MLAQNQPLWKCKIGNCLMIANHRYSEIAMDGKNIRSAHEENATLGLSLDLKKM